MDVIAAMAVRMAACGSVDITDLSKETMIEKKDSIIGQYKAENASEEVLEINGESVKNLD